MVRKRWRVRLVPCAAVVLVCWSAATIYVMRHREVVVVAPPSKEEEITQPSKKKKKKKPKRQRKKKGRRPTPAPTEAAPEASAYPFLRDRRTIRRVPLDTTLRFRVGPRKDLENFVGPTLTALGLVETKAMDWDVYVGLQFKPEYEKNYLLAPNGSLISSIPGLKETIGDKEAFSRLWRRCLDFHNEELCSWTTPAYNFAHKLVNGSFAVAVEGGASEFLDHVRSNAVLPSTWIVKPQRRYLSLGMHLAILTKDNVSSLAELAKWAVTEVPPAEKKRKHHTKQPGEFTVQRYVERPGLVGQRKFDLRLWVLIASLEPLEIYVLDVAFPKISVQDYDGGDLPLNTSTTKEKCMHILMMLSEFCTKKIQFPIYPFHYPGITRPDLDSTDDEHGRAFFQELHLSQKKKMQNGDAAWREWQTSLWPNLERTVLIPLLLAKPALRDHEARIFGAFDSEPARRSHRFALLSPDAVYDVDAHRWRLEEINTNGLFQLGADDDHGRTFHVDHGYTEGWMHIVGATGFPNKSKYQRRLDRRLDNFCARFHCDPYQRRVLERSAHQNAHVAGGWYRLYPPVRCEPNCGLRRPPDLLHEDPLFAKVFKPDLSPLEHLHFAFLAELDQVYFGREPRSTTGSSSFLDYII